MRDHKDPFPAQFPGTPEDRRRLLALAKAANLSHTPAFLTPISVVARGGMLPVSLAQQRLWFLSQFKEASKAYHISGCLRLEGMLDRRALYRALNRVVERHEVLRTR